MLLNRLMSFHGAALPADVDIMFLHDSGGAQPLRNALQALGIDAQVLVKTDFDPEVFYDMVFCIDCPQAFALCERRGFRFVAECHTSYLENRKYLRNLPSACELIVTPSVLFGDRIRGELQDVCRLEVFDLTNFVPWDIAGDVEMRESPGWKKQPILFFGRMDRHKDPLALLDAFAAMEKKQPDRFFCILCGPQSAEIDILHEIRERKLLANVLLLPPLSFNSTNILLDLVRRKNGVFVSPSKGESFGLSAAEAICAGLPVVLSDIEEHTELVRGYQDRLTYQLGNTQSLGARIEEVFDDYETASQAVLEVRERFSSVVFLENWNALLKRLSLQ